MRFQVFTNQPVAGDVRNKPVGRFLHIGVLVKQSYSYFMGFALKDLFVELCRDEILGHAHQMVFNLGAV